MGRCGMTAPVDSVWRAARDIAGSVPLALICLVAYIVVALVVPRESLAGLGRASVALPLLMAWATGTLAVHGVYAVRRLIRRAESERETLDWLRHPTKGEWQLLAFCFIEGQPTLYVPASDPHAQSLVS